MCRRDGLCASRACGHASCEACYASNTTRVSGGVELLVNMQTSVAGYVAIEVLSQPALPRPIDSIDQSATGSARSHESLRPVGGFSLAEADHLKGSAIGAAASWQAGRLASLSALAGRRVALRVAMVDAKLYSLRMVCAAA